MPNWILDLSSIITDILCITPLPLVAAMQPWRTSGARPCGCLHNWILDLSSIIIHSLHNPLLLVAAMHPWRTSGARPCGWLPNWILDLSSIIIDILCIAPLLSVAAMQPWRTIGARPCGWLHKCSCACNTENVLYGRLESKAKAGEYRKTL